VEHSSDAGEPKGTSGKPTLFVLQGNNLINCALIIVRYFGGTKLGTGGLVRAYSDASNLAISKCDLIEYKEMTQESISFEYSDIRMVEYECQLHSIDIIEKKFTTLTIYRIQASKCDLQLFLEKLQRVVNIYPLP
jgi:putative IMPACT (imprinted ancient) family translation regulator